MVSPPQTTSRSGVPAVKVSHSLAQPAASLFSCKNKPIKVERHDKGLEQSAAKSGALESGRGLSTTLIKIYECCQHYPNA
ncbi:hypothetical protein KCU96_g49, partial [Aureobasidium melanogenum]